MNPSLQARSACILLVVLLTGCSSSSNDQPTAPQTVMASPARTPTPKAAPAHSAAAPDVSGTAPEIPAVSSVQPAMPSAEATATTGPVQPPAARSNQANQAILAKQWNAAMEVPGTQLASGSGVAERMVLTTPHATLRNTQTAPLRPANTPMGTRVERGASSNAAKTVVTRVPHGVATPAVQSAAVLRKARFTSLATRFNRPVRISLHGTPTPQPPQHLQMLKMGNVGISNFDDTARVYFALRTSDTDWGNNYVDPRDSREFQCGLVGECLFWMQTGDRPPVYYTMHHDHRYAIFWDSHKGIWDLRIAEQTGGGE